MNNQNHPTQTLVKHKWKEMSENCISQWTCPVLIGNGKYILFIGKNEDSHGIAMYDILNDTFPDSLRSAQPKNTRFDTPAMAFDSKKNLFYVYGGYYHSCFMIYNLNTNQWEDKVVQNTPTDIRNKYNAKHVGYTSRAVLDPQQTLHVIGGERSNKHMIYNASKQVFEEQHTFFQSNLGFGLVCDSMNNRLIVFGGYSAGKYLNKIWFFNLFTKSWTECNFRMELPLAHFGFVFLEKIQIILVFGGATYDGRKTDMVFILDFKTSSCTELEYIQCPIKTWYNAILAPNLSSQTNQSLTNVHLFDILTKYHWSMSLENILPTKYYQLYCNSKKKSEPIDVFELRKKMQLEMKKEREKMFEVVEIEKKLNRNMKQMIENQNLILQQNEKQLQEKEAIIQNKNEEKEIIDLEFAAMRDVLRNKDQELNEEKQLVQQLKENAIIQQKESKEADMEGNYNLKHMKVELLNMREKSFKSFFYSAVAKVADKYYESFVKNDFNDLEIVIELARMEDKNESLRILCQECGMNSLHARQLLRRLSKLSQSNSVFEKWFESREMSAVYEKMLDGGVATFAMFENTFVCCTDFVEFLGGENEEQGIFIWRNMPMKKNMNENINNSNNEFVGTTETPINSNVNGEGYEEGEGENK